jgi:mono/diheme cytochrome c family protein
MAAIGRILCDVLGGRWRWVLPIALVGGCAGTSKQTAPQLGSRQYLAIASAVSPKDEYLRSKTGANGASMDDVVRHDESLAKGTNPYSATDPAALRSGRVVYAAHCASCHGGNADGRGDALAGQYLPAMDFRRPGRGHAIFFRGGRTPHKWFDRVHDGYTAETRRPDGSPIVMPAFRDTLSNEQIWLSLTYLHGVVQGRDVDVTE